MMIEATFKSLDIPGAALGQARAFQPDDPADFGLAITASIGPKNDIGEELFVFLVCTPTWLAREVEQTSHVWGRHLLIVSRWDLGLVESAIERLCAAATGDDWSSLTAKIGRYGHWEFEDYNDLPFDPNSSSRSSDIVSVGAG